MFNLQGSEIIFILLIALVVLGPEKLPGAIRKVTSVYAELRKLSAGFQDEFKSALEEPMREMKTTADLMKNAANPKQLAEEAEREAELLAIADKKAKQARDTTSSMEAAGAAHLAQTSASPAVEARTDAFADPVALDESVPVPRLSSVELVGSDADTDEGTDAEPEDKSA